MTISTILDSIGTAFRYNRDSELRGSGDFARCLATSDANRAIDTIRLNDTDTVRSKHHEHRLGPSERSPEKQRDDRFLVSYKNQIYDISDFIRYHPGGRKVLHRLRNGNLDRAFDENPHSKTAFYLMEDFTVEEGRKVEDNSIDWTAPILYQVGSLADRYWEWVNLPVNRNVRLFRSDFLERLTVTPWYLIPIVWIPLCAYFLYAGCITRITDYTVGTFLEAVASYIFGVLIWTILEYVLHRKLFHFKPPENSKILISLHFLIHGVHHKAPFDDRRLLFPPILGVIVAKGLWHVYQIAFPRTMTYFIAAGTTTGYFCYDMMHYYLHYGAPKFGSYLYGMKRSHNYHHFLHHDRGFGISSRLWDRAFGTDVHLRNLIKPIQW